MCCPLLKRFNTRQQERHIAAQTAAVSSFLNRAFGKPPHTNGGTSGLSSLIYSPLYPSGHLLESRWQHLFDSRGHWGPQPRTRRQEVSTQQPDNPLTQARTPYRPGLGGQVLSAGITGPDGAEQLPPNVYQLNNNYDRLAQ